MNSNKTWQCDRCAQEAETLYFVNGARLCDECRECLRREKRMALRKQEKDRQTGPNKKGMDR